MCFSRLSTILQGAGSGSQNEASRAGAGAPNLTFSCIEGVLEEAVQDAADTERRLDDAGRETPGEQSKAASHHSLCSEMMYKVLPFDMPDK